MIKGEDIGIYSCISKAGNYKSRWDTADEAIEKAKRINKTKKMVRSWLRISAVNVINTT